MIYVSTYIYLYLYLYTNTRTQHTHTHTHIHTYTHISPQTSPNDKKYRKIFKSSVQNHVNENTVTIKKNKAVTKIVLLDSTK